MLSSNMFQPQVAVALTHVNTIINSLRTGSSCVRPPNCSRHHKIESRTLRSEVTEETERKADVRSEKETLASHLDYDPFMAALLEKDNMRKLLLSMGIPESSPWKKNYISAPTFFQNKTGFEERMLKVSYCGIPSIFLRPEVIRLLSQQVSQGCMHVQKRVYHKHHRSTGLGKAYFQENSQSLLGGLTGKGKISEEKIRKIVREETGHPDSIGAKIPQRSSRVYVGRFFAYLISGLMLFYILSTFSARSAPGLPMLGSVSFNAVITDITFDDVKGCDEAKEELADIVNFLKNREKFQAVGAKLPKGVLMVGEPGVGKTLLAKAVAGEAGVPFFHASGSEFDEVFVGSGSRKVRQMFSSAKMRAPSVIFIDEIDSVGGKRTSSQLHPYANQTVNQLLSEMDGFNSTEGVIVIGATNKRENLDRALLRPGRFDMEVKVMLPDVDGRIELFKLYLSKVNADPALDLRKLALLTRGMTGADISNIVNQAALQAVLNGTNVVTMDDLEFARDKVEMGPAWKNRKLDEKAILNTAYHEAGHTLVAYYTQEAMPIHKVTILPRGHALGVTSFVPEEEHKGATKAQLMALIDVAMGGRAGEELHFGKDQVTSGASNDFDKATSIATMMVKKYGMSEKVGQRVYKDMSLDGEPVQADLSEDMKQMVDAEIDKILRESYSRAIGILKSHEKEHRLLSEALIEYETLNNEEVAAVIQQKQLKREAPEKKIIRKDSSETNKK